MDEFARLKQQRDEALYRAGRYAKWADNEKDDGVRQQYIINGIRAFAHALDTERALATGEVGRDVEKGVLAAIGKAGASRLADLLRGEWAAGIKDKISEELLAEELAQEGSE